MHDEEENRLASGLAGEETGAGIGAESRESGAAESDFAARLKDPRPIMIGVVHLLALPGSPGSFRAQADDRDPWMTSVLAAAARDASRLKEGGADAIMVENFGDTPFFPDKVPPETIAAMARAVEVVRDAASNLPIGVNVLRNDARAAVGLCATTSATFLRVNVHVGAMVTDQGLLQGCAAETLRARAHLAPGALLMADVHVKHAQALADQPIAESALETLERGRADLVIVSGQCTGGQPDLLELQAVASRIGAGKVFLGSGLTEDNAQLLLPHARGAVVGTSIKYDGQLDQPVDAERVARLRARMDAC